MGRTLDNVRKRAREVAPRHVVKLVAKDVLQRKAQERRKEKEEKKKKREEKKKKREERKKKKATVPLKCLSYENPK